MINAPSFGVVVVAAGRGERASVAGIGPKQYQHLGGIPVIARTVRAFRAWNTLCPIVIVRHADDKSLLEGALAAEPNSMTIVTGGATRQASVLCGLNALAELSDAPSHVLIHDAARPFVSVKMLNSIAGALKEEPQVGIIPAVPVADTLKEAGPDGFIRRTVPRAGLFMAQTPQAFPLAEIVDAHSRAAARPDLEFTDDASLYEWASLPVRLIPGDKRNMKLTFAEDFAEAERMLRSETEIPIPDVRVGHGYDTHRLVAGHEITLCGVKIPHDRRLSGHSDADVGYHALTDALLATVGEGDIGSHFPPTDPQWRGASSDIFLAHAARLVRDTGARITHCDVTLLCENPKIGPHREAMREAISAVVGIEVERISVKATTNERSGFIGREEGIVALATATAVFTAQGTIRE